MNDSTGARPARPRRSRLRAGVLAAFLAGVAVLATACGGSPAAKAGPSFLQAALSKALAYSACMRSHGIVNFPDPTHNSRGVTISIPESIDSNSPQYQAADKACRRQSGFGQVSAAVLQQAMSMAVKFAECMRSHGIPDFPDPVENGNGVQAGPSPGSGIDQNSPQYKAARNACRAFRPGGTS